MRRLPNSFRMAFLAILLPMALIPSLHAQTSILAPTPPMGWNSWNCFHENINEQKIKEIADAMVLSGMRDAGYEYLVLDDGWMAKDRDANGNLQADPEKFPKGMKELGDYIHNKGLKFGIYECRGYLTCQRLPGSFEHEDADMAIFASWGVDYIKLDACYAEKNGRLTTDDLRIYKEAIAKTSRPMILSISDFGNGAWAWGGKKFGQLWRTSYDIYPWIENVYHHSETSGGDLRIHPAFNGLWQFAGPGHWNDPDMLEIGNLKSEVEDKIHMSLWCMLAAPLMAGNDLRIMSDSVTRVLNAPEIIAVNQDPRGHQGYKVFDNGKQIIYNKPLADGTTAVLMFNKDSVPADITVGWDQIGLSGKQNVRDLWQRKNLGKFNDSFTAVMLPQHGQYLLKVGTPGRHLIAGPDPVPVEKYTPSKDGYTFLSDIYYIMKYGEAPGYDHTVDKASIQMNTVKYKKGLSCQDGSILIYKLAGNAKRFRALVGLDDAYMGKGTGRFRVMNEDAFGAKVLYDSGLMTRYSLPKQIDIDVTGLDCLFLKFDGKGATGDWALARLVASWDENRIYYEDQYIDSLISQMELIPIRINGDKNNRINIVIINRWEKRDTRPYNSPELRAEFIDDVNRSLLAAFTPGHPDAQTRYANYEQFFNLYALWWPDAPEWKTGDMDTDLVDAIRDRLFLPWENAFTGWVTFLIMPNRDGGGGGAARNLEDRTGNAVIVGNAIGKMLHEISHTCSSIGDEYTAGATGTTAIPVYTTTLDYQRDKIPWRAWVEPTTPLPTPYTAEYIDKVGAFEGSQYHLTNYFRSSAQGCIMGAGVFDNTEEMCVVCGQRISMRVYTLVYPIEKAYPANQKISFTQPSTQHFSVQRVHPIPDTQETHWILNGKVIASGTDQIDLSFDSNEENEVVFTLRDTTDFIREDPPFGEFPYRERRWVINPGATKSTSHYTFVWTDSDPKYPAGERYEAESAGYNQGEATINSYFGASEQEFVKFGKGSEPINWSVKVDKPGWHELQIVYASGQKGSGKVRLSVNGRAVENGLILPETRPLYTGWADVTIPVELKNGINKISLSSLDSRLIHLDYIWIPNSSIPKPADRVKQKNFDLPMVELTRLRSGAVTVKNPDPRFEYQWFSENVPVFEVEHPALPLATGLEFHPTVEGNYYVGVRSLESGATSSNRRGFYYSENPPAKNSRQILPDRVKSAKLLLWLDASDLNGDGQVDDPAPKRDPNNNWIDKAFGIKGPFILYKPNSLNNMGVAGFENVWVTNLEKPVKGYQTIIMVCKQGSMSFPGTTPFRTLDKLMNIPTQPDAEKYQIYTKEFDSKMDSEIKTTSGYWEGSLAEFIVYDGILSDKERKAVVTGLRRKWFSLSR